MDSLARMAAFIQEGAVCSLGEEKLLIGWGNLSWQEEKTHFGFPDFFLEEKRCWLKCDEVLEVSREELLVALAALPQTAFEGEFSCDPRHGLEKALEAVQNDLEKVVPYRIARANGEFTKENRTFSLQQLLKKRGYLYGFWKGEEGMLGLTPEKLFSVEGDQLKTMALAGTMGAHETEEEFFCDPKEAHEHQVVVDSLLSSLKTLGSVEVGEKALHKAGPLTHLITPFQVQLPQGVTSGALVAQLHPTSALGGHPTGKALQFLKEFALKQPRKRFGAPVVVQKEQELHAFVAIRGVQWAEGEVHLTAGGGFVAASTLEGEVAEIERKMRAVLQLFGGESVLV